MQVEIDDRQSDLPLFVGNIETIVFEVVNSEGQRASEVGIHFVSQDEISRLHGEYFSDPSPTDCISLPIDYDKDAEHKMLGDSIICPRTAIDYAAAHGLDPYEECTLYLVHSLLHLMGYDDTTDETERIMRKRESFHMERLRARRLLLTPPAH